MSWRSRSQRGQTELVWTVQIGHVEKDSGVLWGGRMAKLQAAGRRPRRKSREELHGRGERWGQSVRLPAKTPFSANPDWNLEWIFCSVNSHKPHRSHFFCKMFFGHFGIWTAPSLSVNSYPTHQWVLTYGSILRSSLSRARFRQSTLKIGFEK